MNLSNRLLAGVSALCAVGLGHGALAADIPVKARPPVVASVYNWTGFYIGAHVGYGRGQKDWTEFTLNYDVSGWLGGGQIGFNQQVGNFVFGIEADASWSNIKGSQTLTLGGPAIGFTQTAIGSTEIDRIVTVAGRLGFAQDRWLVYVKGGAAWVHENHAFNVSLNGALAVGGPAITAAIVGAGSEDRFGAMLGIGSEFALWGNWSFKSEYNYIHLPTGAVTMIGRQALVVVPIPFAFRQHIPETIHLAKFGINYRFGSDAPPAIAPSAPAFGYNWTGAWIGAQAGYGFGTTYWRSFIPSFVDLDVGGWLGGVTAGANVQSGAFVFGVETEWLHSGIVGADVATFTAPGLTQVSSRASRLNWLSLNSIRAGFVAADRWLVYVKGGVALADTTHTRSLQQTSTIVASSVTDWSGNALDTGYLAGFGLEYAFLGNWSAKLEYNYINVRRQDVAMIGFINSLGRAPTADINRLTFGQELHLVKIGVNYHFDSFTDLMKGF